VRAQAPKARLRARWLDEPWCACSREAADAEGLREVHEGDRADHWPTGRVASSRERRADSFRAWHLLPPRQARSWDAEGREGRGKRADITDNSMIGRCGADGKRKQQREIRENEYRMAHAVRRCMARWQYISLLGCSPCRM